MQRIVAAMMAEAKALVKFLVEQAAGVRDGEGAAALERAVRQRGQAFLCRLLERLLQSVLDRQQQARRCPRCGSRRQHKGVRGRGVVSSVGAIRLEGPYWYCPRCWRGEHALDALLPGSVSGVMEELLCLLGTSMASFGKAARASEKLLGVRLSTEMIWRLCHGVGRRVLAHAPPPPEVPLGAELVGSCDGTMVNTHQDGWRELKVYRYEHPGGVCGAAYLGRSERFAPRLG